MELEMVLVLVLGLLMGSVLGYWSVLLRVWRLEKELAQETALAEEWAKLPCLESDLESDLAKQLTKALARQSELEMALDYQMSKAMGKD